MTSGLTESITVASCVVLFLIDWKLMFRIRIGLSSLLVLGVDCVVEFAVLCELSSGVRGDCVVLDMLL